MGIRSFFAKPLAARVVKKYRLSQQQAFERQDFWLKQMVAKAEKTLFGRGHSFSKIKNYLDYRSNVPIFEYEDIKPYIDEVVSGKEDILWPGKPAYFAKTSGTTSGV